MIYYTWPEWVKWIHNGSARMDFGSPASNNWPIMPKLIAISILIGYRGCPCDICCWSVMSNEFWPSQPVHFVLFCVWVGGWQEFVIPGTEEKYLLSLVIPLQDMYDNYLHNVPMNNKDEKCMAKMINFDWLLLQCFYLHSYYTSEIWTVLVFRLKSGTVLFFMTCMVTWYCRNIYKERCSWPRLFYRLL